MIVTAYNDLCKKLPSEQLYRLVGTLYDGYERLHNAKLWSEKECKWVSGL